MNSPASIRFCHLFNSPRAAITVIRTTGSLGVFAGTVAPDAVGVSAEDADEGTAVKVHRPKAQLRMYRPGKPELGGDAAFSPVDAAGASKQ